MKEMNHKFKEFVKTYPDGGNEQQSICNLGIDKDQNGSIGEGGRNCRRDSQTHASQRQANGADLEVRKEK